MRVRSSSIRLLDEQTGELVIQAVSNLSAEYINKGPVTLERNSIDESAMAGEVVYIRDVRVDPRTRYPEQARREGIVSGLVAGMIYHGKPIGVIRVYSAEEKSFDSFDMSLLRVMATNAAAAIVHARLMAEALEGERHARQLRLAADVQRRMLPATPPSTPHAELASLYEPSLELSGDLCDFLDLSDSRCGLVIADVAGKGVASALLMASIRGALRTLARAPQSIDQAITAVNVHLCQDTLIGDFATLFYGELSADGTTLDYCNAGHDPPLLLRDGQITELSSSGFPIGIVPDATYAAERIELRPGDVLLLYTDGAVDALTFQGECFGRARLRDSLLRYADQPTERLVQQILWDIRRFIGLARQSDDITLIAARIK
jgi:sigma-B regulation protein RsbU (phosphoserine phosphatase)